MCINFVPSGCCVPSHFPKSRISVCGESAISVHFLPNTIYSFLRRKRHQRRMIIALEDLLDDDDDGDARAVDQLSLEFS